MLYLFWEIVKVKLGFLHVPHFLDVIENLKTIFASSHKPNKNLNRMSYYSNQPKINLSLGSIPLRAILGQPLHQAMKLNLVLICCRGPFDTTHVRHCSLFLGLR